MRRAFRYFAWFAAATVVLLISFVIFLAVIVDTPPVEAEIRRQLSSFVHGEFTWEDLRIRVLPVPHGELRKVRVEIPGVASISAEQAEGRLRVWPLLRGRAEIASFTLVRPDIRFSFKPAPAAKEKLPEETAALDVVELYRSIMDPVVQAVREFAPNTDFAIENAEVDVRTPGIPPIQLNRLTIRARTGKQGMDLDASAASPYWTRLTLSARIAFTDLSARVSLNAADIKPQAWLDEVLAKSPVGVSVSRANLSAQVRTDGAKSLECEFTANAGLVEVARAAERVKVEDVAVKGKVVADAGEIAVHVGDTRLGRSRLPEGVLRYSPKDGLLTGDIGYDLDLAQGMDYTRRLAHAEAGAALSWFKPVTGRAQGRVKLELGRRDWRVAVHIAKSDAAVQIRDLPGPVRLAHGNVELDRHGVRVRHAAASMPAGQVRLSTLHHSYRDGATTAVAEFDVDVARGMELARRASGDELTVIQSAGGRARGHVKLAFGRKDWSVATEIQKTDAQVQVKGLPGPAGLSSGSVLATSGRVQVDRAVVTLLDTKATASTTISFRDELRVQGSIAEGIVGEKFLDWVWKTAAAPPHLLLKTPINVTAQQFTWGPKGALDVQATARFPAGPGVAVDLGWTPAALHVRRAAVKDGQSDAVIAVRSAGRRVEGGFSGSLYGSSVSAALRSVIPREGSASGKFRFVFDRDRPRDATADGSLKGESLDLSWLIGQPLRIERIDLAVEGTSLRVREAMVNWAGQRATIRGDLKQGTAGPVINAQLDSPGIDVDALLKATDSAKKPPAAKPEPSRLWPLPVTGQFSVRSNFLQRGRYRIAPIAATLALQPERARLDVRQAQLCGISLPMTIEATPGGVNATVKVTAQKQQLQQAAHCLTDQHVLITGEFDLQANVTSQGKLGELARNMEGSVTADMRDGDIMKFALLGNILSLKGITALLKEGAPRVDEKGFPYHTIAIKGRFANGRFNVDEGALRSDALGLAANGWISLTEPQSRLTVLVAPFSRLDALARSVPLFGYVVGGAFTSVPVGVSGDIRDPLVVPLGPGAVGSEVLGIFERTLKLPVKLITPLEK